MCYYLDHGRLSSLYNTLQQSRTIGKNEQQYRNEWSMYVSKWKEFRFYNDKKWFLSFSLEYSFMLWKAVIQAKYINIMEGNFLNIKVEIENGTICYELWGVVQCCKVIV